MSEAGNGVARWMLLDQIVGAGARGACVEPAVSTWRRLRTPRAWARLDGTRRAQTEPVAGQPDESTPPACQRRLIGVDP